MSARLPAAPSPPDTLSYCLCSAQGSPGAPPTCEAGEWSHHDGTSVVTSGAGTVDTGSGMVPLPVLGVPVPWGRGGTRHTSPSALCLLQALSTTQPLLCSGPNATQLEDAASGANGLPRRQAPVPSLETPPQLSICAGPSEGGDGKSRVPGAPGQACLYCSCPACPGAAPGLWGRDRGADRCPSHTPGTAPRTALRPGCL